MLAVAVNKDRNPPTICTDPKAEAAVHSEINALRQLKGVDWSRVTIYNARVLKDGTPAISKPCHRCQEVLDSLGVRRVIHT